MRAIPHFASATIRLAMSKMLCIPIFIVYLSPELFLWNFDFDRSKNRIKQTEIYFFVLLNNLGKRIFEVTFEQLTPKTCWRLICFLLNYFRKTSNSKNIFSSKKLSFFMFLFLMLLKKLVENSKKNIFKTHVLNTPYTVNFNCWHDLGTKRQ